MCTINYSFIIPHHNSPELLNRCLDSIPYRDDIQIIVVDDNSKEDAKPQIDRIGVELIYIEKEDSKGAGHARNLGIEKAIGKWLLFPDCDDYYTDHLLEVIDKYKDEDFDVLYFDFKYIDGITGERLDDIFFHDDIVNYNGSKDAIEKIRYRHNVPWTKMVSKTLVTNYKLRYEECINGNDIYFSLLLGFYAKKIVVDKTAVYVYIKNPTGITAKGNISVQAAMCRINHIMKCNAWYKHVGHREWGRNPIKYAISVGRRLGISFYIQLCSSFFSIYSNRKEWVYSIPSKNK